MQLLDAGRLEVSYRHMLGEFMQGPVCACRALEPKKNLLSLILCLTSLLVKNPAISHAG